MFRSVSVKGRPETTDFYLVLDTLTRKSMHLCIIIYFVLEEPQTKPAIVIHNKDRNINGSGLGKIFKRMFLQ